MTIHNLTTIARKKPVRPASALTRIKSPRFAAVLRARGSPLDRCQFAELHAVVGWRAHAPETPLARSHNSWPASVAAAMALAAACLASDAETTQRLSPADEVVLLAALDRAVGQGFSPGEFDTRSVRALLASPGAEEQAQGEARLEAMAVAFAAAEHGERLSASRFPETWAIRPAAYDAAADLTRALAQHQLSAWLASLPPPDPRYSALASAYQRYAAIVAAGGWSSLATPLRPGARGPAVRSLLQRLRVEDPTVAAGDAYDDASAAAVARAQARYGLDESGVADAPTIAALDVPAPARLGQLAANLERLRWMDRSLPDYRVELNIAAQQLILFDEGRPLMQMRAIVGRPDRQTPSFSDAITAVVFNPPWNVPADIAAREIWPEARRDPGYFKREGFVVRPGGGVQQLPGPRCALGVIKFDLSNPFGVYMHDTPTKSLFSKNARLFSHGCMRLEHPLDLAKRVLAGDAAWPASRIDEVLDSGATIRATLPQPVPVYVVYWTAFIDAEGALEFRADPYRWDQRLLVMLPA